MCTTDNSSQWNPHLREDTLNMQSDVCSFILLFIFSHPQLTFKVNIIYSICLFCQKSRSKKRTFINPKSDKFLKVPSLGSVGIFILNCEYGICKNLSTVVKFPFTFMETEYFSDDFVSHTCKSVLRDTNMRIAFWILFIMIYFRTLATLRATGNALLKSPFLYKQKFEMLNYIPQER